MLKQKDIKMFSRGQVRLEAGGSQCRQCVEKNNVQHCPGEAGRRKAGVRWGGRQVQCGRRVQVCVVGRCSEADAPMIQKSRCCRMHPSEPSSI